MTCRLLPSEALVMQKGIGLAFPILGKWIEIYAVLTSTRLNPSQFLDWKSASLFRTPDRYSAVIMISLPIKHSHISLLKVIKVLFCVPHFY